jgi:tetratricopeptide (TPR) repeat protein
VRTAHLIGRRIGHGHGFDHNLFSARFAVIEGIGVIGHCEWCAMRTIHYEIDCLGPRKDRG